MSRSIILIFNSCWESDLGEFFFASFFDKPLSGRFYREEFFRLGDLGERKNELKKKSLHVVIFFC